MSITTAEIHTVYHSARNVLADYELHYSRSESVTGGAPIPSQLTHPESTEATNPPDWPTTQRRVPPHRPVNYHLDPSERNVFLNTGERVFVNVMFLGVRINATVNALWRTTGGRLNDGIFRYDVGGES